MSPRHDSIDLGLHRDLVDEVHSRPLLSAAMRETPEEVERDFDLWKLDRDAQEETHQAEFVQK